MILMAMFGGGMIRLLFVPGFMRTLSHFSPVKWSMLDLEGAIWGLLTRRNAVAVRDSARHQASSA
jgi:hypothetical protein